MLFQGTVAHSQHLRRTATRVCSAQVPEVVTFGFNATLLAGGPAGGDSGSFLQQLSFPLFAAGERRAQAPWAGRGPLPAGLQEAYVPSQLVLLCVSQARSRSSNANQMQRLGMLGREATFATFCPGCWHRPSGHQVSL